MNHKINKKELKRFVFYRDSSRFAKPVQGLGEFKSEQMSEAVRVEGIPCEDFHGFYITDDQAVGNEQLGTREQLTANMRRWFGRHHADQILDERVTARLRRVTAREMNVERQNMGWWARQTSKATGFVRNLRSILWRTNSDSVGIQMEQRYGLNREVENNREYLSEQVLNPLGVAQRNTLSAFLTAQRVAPFAAPGNLPVQIQQMANAHPQVLMLMRETFSPPMGAIFPSLQYAQQPLFPRMQQVPPTTPIDRLIEYRHVEATERKKMLATTVYDPRRLQAFLDLVRTSEPDIYADLEKLLEDNSLYPLENNAEAQALVAYLEYRWRAEGGGNLRTQMARIRQNLPTTNEKREEGHEPSAELLRIEKTTELTKALTENYNKLRLAYNKAPAVGEDLYRTTVEFNGLVGAPRDTARQAKSNAVEALRKEKRAIQDQISEMEGTYRDTMAELLDILASAEPSRAIPLAVAPNDPRAMVITVNAQINPPGGGVSPIAINSTEDQLFGITDPGPPAGPVVNRVTPIPRSLFTNHVLGLGKPQIAALEKQVKDHYHPLIKGREKVDCRQLLYLFKMGDLTRAGITNDEMRRKYAMLATNTSVVDANSIQLFRSTNLELSERLGETTLGMRWLNRLGKWAGAKLNLGGIYEAKDIINYVSGFDKDFAMFRGMRKDITLPELRDLMIKNGGMKPAKLFEFATKLKEVFQSFEILSTDGKVELYERDAMDMEQLIHMLLVVREELRGEDFFAEIRNKSHVNKPEAILKKMKTDTAAAEAEEKDILSKFAGRDADWKQLFAREVLKDKYLSKLHEARKHMKEQKMTATQRRKYLNKEGLATAYDVFRTALAAKETFDIASTGAKWSWNALKGGAEFTYDTGSGLLGGVWNKMIRPVGYYGVYRPTKFVLWDAPKWTLDKAWKITTFPFRLVGRAAGSTWNFVAKPSGSGHGGGHSADHGGGGHGAEHKEAAHGGHFEVAEAANDNGAAEVRDIRSGTNRSAKRTMKDAA